MLGTLLLFHYMSYFIHPRILLVISGMAASLTTGLADDFLITNSNDSGPGSLRQAIIDANNHPGPDSIFKEPFLSGIYIETPLPALTDGETTISGGWIRIVSTGSAEGAPGLRIQSPGNLVKDLVLGYFSHGIEIKGPHANGNTVMQTQIYGCSGHGILIDNSSYNLIGRIQSGTNGNWISGNTLSGISIRSGVGNRVGGNSFVRNGFLPIDLGDDGSTPNDANDSDSGANNLQNFPTLFSAQSWPGRVAGTFVGNPLTTYCLELLWGTVDVNLPISDAASITTDEAGVANFSVLSPSSNGDQMVTAAISDSEGNTSELAPSVRVSQDSDGDGIEDVVDGHMESGVFINEARVPSERFTDEHIPGGTTSGEILNRRGLTISVTRDLLTYQDNNLPPAYAPTNGFRIAVVGPAGGDPSEVKISNSEPGSTTSTNYLPAGTLTTEKCGSITSRVIEGRETIVVGENAVTLTKGGAVRIKSSTTGDSLLVSNLADSTSSILVETDGASSVLQPGQKGVLGEGKVIQIDIKPGSFPNAIKLKETGTVPVAILSSSTFDARTVDPSTVVFAGAKPALTPSRNPLYSFTDVNKDKIKDMVIHFPVQDLIFHTGDQDALLEAKSIGGDVLLGSDTVKLIP